jgi:hypothetical protein
MPDRDEKPKPKPRREVTPIKVWVTELEKEDIVKRSKQSNLSMSSYLLTSGLNHPIRSVVDLKAVTELAKVNGDLGRVAGLLKLWLSEKRGQGAKPLDVENMMIEFRSLQNQMLTLMSQVVR